MDLSTLEEMVLIGSGQNCTMIAPELKTHADNAKHGLYCYISITTIYIVPVDDRPQQLEKTQTQYGSYVTLCSQAI